MPYTSIPGTITTIPTVNTIPTINSIPSSITNIPSAASGVNFNTVATGLGLTVLAAWQSDLGITLNGSTVSAWADQSGGGNALSQGTASAQPLFTASDATVNNAPSLTFDGVNDALSSSTLNLPAPNLWIYSVVQQVAWVSAGILWDGGTGDNYALTGRGASPGMESFNGVFSSVNNAMTVGSWFRVYQTFTNSTSDVLKIGSTFVTGVNTGAADPAANWFLGRGFTANFVNMKMTLQLIGTGTPSAGNVSTLDSNVTTMYGAGVGV